jgi:hypothetical protein
MEAAAAAQQAAADQQIRVGALELAVRLMGSAELETGFEVAGLAEITVRTAEVFEGYIKD